MNTNLTETLIKNNIQNQINGLYVAPLVLASMPGQGKTSLIRNVSNEGNLHLVNVSLPTISVEQLGG